jgi:hypothetical protein
VRPADIFDHASSEEASTSPCDAIFESFSTPPEHADDDRSFKTNSNGNLTESMAPSPPARKDRNQETEWDTSATRRRADSRVRRALQAGKSTDMSGVDLARQSCYEDPADTNEALC